MNAYSFQPGTPSYAGGGFNPPAQVPVGLGSLGRNMWRGNHGGAVLDKKTRVANTARTLIKRIRRGPVTRKNLVAAGAVRSMRGLGSLGDFDDDDLSGFGSVGELIDDVAADMEGLGALGADDLDDDDLLSAIEDTDPDLIDDLSAIDDGDFEGLAGKKKANANAAPGQYKLAPTGRWLKKGPLNRPGWFPIKGNPPAGSIILQPDAGTKPAALRTRVAATVQRAAAQGASLYTGPRGSPSSPAPNPATGNAPTTAYAASAPQLAPIPASLPFPSAAASLPAYQGSDAFVPAPSAPAAGGGWDPNANYQFSDSSVPAADYAASDAAASDGGGYQTDDGTELSLPQGDAVEAQPDGGYTDASTGDPVPEDGVMSGYFLNGLGEVQFGNFFSNILKAVAPIAAGFIPVVGPLASGIVSNLVNGKQVLDPKGVPILPPGNGKIVKLKDGRSAIADEANVIIAINEGGKWKAVAPAKPKAPVKPAAPKSPFGGGGKAAGDVSAASATSMPGWALPVGALAAFLILKKK